MKPTEGVTAEIVVSHVRSLIERGELRPGDRLPPERELAVQLGVSRPSVRAGLRSLAAIGVLQTRHGAGTFITDGPPTLGSEPLSFLAALHGFTRDEMFEARRALEVGRGGPVGRAGHRRSDRDHRRGSDGDVRQSRRRADVSDSRHPVPSRSRGGVGQSDPGVAGRDGVGAVLRAAEEDGQQRARSQAVRAGASQHLPRHPGARRQARARRDERALVAGAAGAGPRRRRRRAPLHAAGGPVGARLGRAPAAAHAAPAGVSSLPPAR